MVAIPFLGEPLMVKVTEESGLFIYFFTFLFFVV